MENLLAIFQAMDRIKPIDRSEYFNNYYQELISRLQTESKVKEWIEGNLNLIVQGNSQETDRDRQETDGALFRLL
jgi:hypothetical protein